jgi:hypothetical protein
MTSLNILSIQRLSDNERTMIAAVDDSVNLTVAGGWFDGEIRDTWPEFAANRYLPAGSNGKGTKAERGKLLADADIIIGGWPFPFDLRTRATKMQWFHQQPAEKRLVGQRCHRHHIARVWQYSGHRRICVSQHLSFRERVSCRPKRPRQQRVRLSRLQTARR